LFIEKGLVEVHFHNLRGLYDEQAKKSVDDHPMAEVPVFATVQPIDACITHLKSGKNTMDYYDMSLMANP
jgi:tRNA (guanine37-N1)-methyltransferase